MDAALQRLIDHRAEFLAYLRKQGATAEQAEDVLQSALARGLEPWSAPPEGDSVVPWFYRVLRNAFIDQTRRSSAAGRALERYASEIPDPETPTDARRICTCTRRVLASLKPEYRQMVEWVDVDGAAVEEAARRAGITANNASVRLHRARRALRDRLETVCGSCATGGGRCSDCYCRLNEAV